MYRLSVINRPDDHDTVSKPHSTENPRHLLLFNSLPSIIKTWIHASIQKRALCSFEWCGTCVTATVALWKMKTWLEREVCIYISVW